MENSEGTTSKSQTLKLKVFHVIQKNFAAVGFSSNLVTQQYPFNKKIFMGILILSTSVICNLMYIFREAKTFAEYNQSIYMCSLAAAIIFASVIILLNVKKLFNLIKVCENVANTSSQTIESIQSNSQIDCSALVIN